MTVRYMLFAAALLIKCSGALSIDCVVDGDCSGGACDLGGTCSCPPGQYGPNCNSPCSADEECNGGSCTKDFLCKCPPLQTGDNCATQNECDENTPCGEGMECDMTEPFSCVVPTPVTIAAEENCGALGECRDSSAQNMAVSLLLQLVMLGTISLM